MKTHSRPLPVFCSTLAACSLLISSASLAAPQYQRLSFTGDTSTTMTVVWNTIVEVTASEVKYGISAGNLTKTVTATSNQANAGLGYVHEATMTGLQPNTQYFYVVGSATDSFSAEKSFRTGPVQNDNCGSFKFVFLGDNRPDKTFGGGENWPQILGQSIQQNPDFVVNGGDLVIDGDQIDEWLKFLGWTEPVASQRAFMPAIGNHDTGPGEGDSANYNQLFALPRSTGANGSNTEDYYYFTYGNAIFVALSTEGFEGGSIPFGKQATWLDEVLTNNPRKWKIVYYHKPTYTFEAFFDISHKPNEEGQNAAWVEIFDKHHVDVVLTSHNHWYERYEPSACAKQGKAGSSSPCPVGATNYADGTVYYVSGGAGAFTIPALLCGWQAGRPACSGDHHYIIFDIQNETMKVDTWGAFPQANKVIDSITITKGADNCTTTPPDASVPDAAASDSQTPPVDGPTPEDTLAPPDGDVADDIAATDTKKPASDTAPTPPSSDGGCSCRAGGATSGAPTLMLVLGALLLVGRLRRWHSVIVIAVLSALCLLGCSKKAQQSKPATFSCKGLQQRVEACEKQALSLVKKQIKTRAAKDVADHSEQQFKMFKKRFVKKLRNKQTQKQCDKFCTAKKSAYSKQVATMKRCYSEKGCEPFVRCLLKI